MADDHMQRTVLVTGAQGFIGSWLAERLLDGGARVVVPRRDVDPRARFRTEGLAERCVVVDADVRDGAALDRLFAEHPIDGVFHLAAQPIVRVANRSPLSTFESNVRGTYTLLDVCRTHAERLRSIVVASSDHAYGRQPVLPLREEFGLRGVFPYDASKRCADMIARSYASAYGLPVAVTRFANVFGGGDLNWSRIVPDSARRLVAGEPPVIRSDGTPERDYLYVEDAIEAYLAIARGVEERPELAGRAWNAGHGRGVSVAELVGRLVAVSRRDVEPEVHGRGTPPAEIERQFLDASAMRDELGWRPRWSLDDALAATYGWYERLLRTPALTS
jgi:CDP-glucose 4,6-dehydratase